MKRKNYLFCHTQNLKKMHKKPVGLLNLLPLFAVMLILTLAGCKDAAKPSGKNEETPSVRNEKPDIPNKIVMTTEESKIKIKIKTKNDSPVKVKGATSATILGDGSEQELTKLAGNTENKFEIITEDAYITEFFCGDEYGKPDKNNKITELTLGGLKQLELLNCRNNKLESLDLTGLTELKVLDCPNNKITSLNFADTKKLQILTCYKNELSSPDLTKMPDLTEVYCGLNAGITSLDLSNLKKLRILHCDNCKLPELNISKLKELEDLSCNANQLSELNISGLPKLKVLSFMSNKINEENMTKILNALPKRESTEKARCILYHNNTDKNYHDFDTALNGSDIKKAFDAAKGKNWNLYKSGYNNKNENENKI